MRKKIAALISLAALLSPSLALATNNIQAHGAFIHTGLTGTTQTSNFTFTDVSGLDHGVLICTMSPNGADDLTSVTIDGNAMTRATHVTLPGSRQRYVYTYAPFLGNGASHTVVETFTTAHSPSSVLCENVTGVDESLLNSVISSSYSTGFATTTSLSGSITTTYDQSIWFGHAIASNQTVSATGAAAVTIGSGGQNANKEIHGVPTLNTNGSHSFTVDSNVSTQVSFDVFEVAPYDYASLSNFVRDATSGYSNQTGFTIDDTVGWAGDNLIKLFIGSGLALMYNLRFWIVALIIIAIIAFFAFRALRRTY